MKKVIALLFAFFILSSCFVPVFADDTISSSMPSEQYRSLAEYWAPTIYQDVNESYLYRCTREMCKKAQLLWGLFAKKGKMSLFCSLKHDTISFLIIKKKLI